MRELRARRQRDREFTLKDILTGVTKKTITDRVQLPAIAATPSQEATVTARVDVAVVASKVSERAASSGKALVAIGMASTA